MINPFQAMQVMSNPMGALQQQLLQKMKAQNPQMFQQTQNMTSGRSEAELKTLRARLEEITQSE